MGGLLGVFGPAAGTAPVVGAIRGPGYALGGELTHRGRFAVAFTGELHNRERLRHILLVDDGCGSDADLVAAAHRRWGEAAPQYLRGTFAYLARDSRTGRVHGARDRFGVRPLFYAHRAGSLYVAADQRALADLAGAAGAVDPAALSHYLSLRFVPEPATMRRSVARLPVASTLAYEAAGGGPRIQRYWRARLAPARDGDAAGLPAALRDSIRVSSSSTQDPVGVLYSGGIESAALARLAAETEPAVRVLGVGFDVPNHGLADLDAARLGLPTTDIVVTAADVIAELPRIVGHLADPVADPAAVPLHFLARAAARQAGAVLTATGADELFGGHPAYRRAAPSLLTRRTPAERLLAGGVFSDADKAALLRHHDARVRPAGITGPLLAELPAGTDAVTAMQHVDLHTRLPAATLAAVERLTSAHGLRLRTPYLDPAVLAIAARLPARQKVNRRALRRAFHDLVPAGVPDAGMRVPIAAWLRSDLGEWADTVIAGSAAGDLLRLDRARGLLHAHRAGGADHARKVWTVLVFCLWHATFVENAAPGASRHLARVEHVF